VAKPTETEQPCNVEVECEYEWKRTDGECTKTCKGGTETPTAACVLKGTDVASEGMCTDTPTLNPLACNADIPCEVLVLDVTYGGTTVTQFNAKTAQFKGAYATSTNMDAELITLKSVDAVLRRRLQGGVLAKWQTNLDDMSPEQTNILLNTVSSDTFSDDLKAETETETDLTLTSTGVVDATEYEVVGDFTDISCASTCAGGSRTTTTVSCVIKGGDTVVAASHCDGTTEVTEACNADVVCEYEYKSTPGTCSSTCTGGTQTLTVSCVLKGTDTSADLSMCVGTAPSTEPMACNSDVICAPTLSPVIETTGGAVEQSAGQLCLLTVILMVTLMF